MGDFRDILDKIDSLKRKYESKISLMIVEHLEDFRQEFGELPVSINVHSNPIYEAGSRPPYALDVITKIDVEV